MDRSLNCSFSHPWLRTWVDELEPFHWEIMLAYFCIRPFQNMFHRIWWVLGSQRVGEADLVVLACKWVMSTEFVQSGELLGLVALGCHQVVSTLRIENVITGSLGSCWYCTWSISGLQVFTVFLCLEMG